VLGPEIEPPNGQAKVRWIINTTPKQIGRHYAMAGSTTFSRKGKKIVMIPTPTGGLAPFNTIAPSATGTVAVGNLLSCTSGTWTSTTTVTYSYQWQRNGVDISGATANTYTCVNADLGANLTCVVTAANQYGVSYSRSNQLTSISNNGTVVYDTTMGNAVDVNGFTDLPLRSGATYYFVNASTGNDSNTGLSNAQALATVTAAMNKVTDLNGDQILIAQGTSYNEVLPSLNAKRGFSPQYPTVFRSYDPADSTNTAKYGRATAGNRPQFTGGNWITNGGGAGSQPAGKLVFQGLYFNPANGSTTGGLGLTILPGTGYSNDYILFENCIFNAYGVVVQEEGNIGAITYSTCLIFRNCASYGQWGYSISGGYFSAIDHVTIEDCVWYHNGWKVGATRDQDYSLGGVANTGGRNHAFYIQEDSGSICSRRNLFIDSSYDGGQNRTSVLCHNNVYIDMPIASPLGSGTAYTVTRPTGVDIDYCYNFVIGDAEPYTGYGGRWGIVSVNGRPDSVARYNVFVRSNDLTSTSAHVMRTDAIAAIAPQPSYMTYNNNISYLRIGVGFGVTHYETSTTGNPTYTAGIHAAFNNNIWDDAASGTNVNVSSYSPTNAYTAAQLYAALTPTFSSVTDKASLISFAIANPEQHIQRQLWTLGWAGYNGHTPSLETLTTTIDVTSGLKESSIIIGTTDGSTLTAIGAPSWLVLNSSNRSWSYDGTTQVTTSGSFTLRETLNGVSNDSTITYKITAPPSLSLASVTGVTSTTATLNVTTSGSTGNIQWIVDSHPTWWDGRRNDIRFHFSTAGAYSAADVSGTFAVSSSGAKAISISGLTASNSYVAYAVHVDSNGYPSAAIGPISFTTTAGGATTHWNSSTDTPPSNSQWAISGASNNIGTMTGSPDSLLRASAPLTAGKSYDITLTAVAMGPGVCTSSFGTSNWVGNTPGSMAYASDGSLYLNGSVVQNSLATYTVGDTLRFTYDGTHIQCYKKISGSFVAQGTAVDISATISAPYPATNGQNGSIVTADFTNS
jgi:hypothetical protein